MPDIEKVIKGLECCFNPNSENSCLCNCKECPYNPPDDEDWTQMCQVDLNRDALALLKDLEPVEPFEEGIMDFNCGNCGAGLYYDHDWEYCPHCGRKVKWDD